MKRYLLVALVLSSAFSLNALEPPAPFVDYPKPVAEYLKRTQQGKQAHSFDGSKDFSAWQQSTRASLIELTGLKGMKETLAEFVPTVSQGEPEEIDGKYLRSLCSIETEPGIDIPFYLLVPKSAGRDSKTPLVICPHGHHVRGFHFYAGSFKDEKNRTATLAKEGNIAEQAVLQGYIAIAPATRGLAKEVLVPDPKNRHGKRACRAQLMHCLLTGRTAIAERVWDMQCILDWAETHPLVDPERIAMTGNSGGGVVTAYAAAIDPRIKVAIPSCSFTSVASEEGFIFLCDCCLVPGIRNWGDFSDIGGLIAPRRLLIVHGPMDGLHNKRDVENNASDVAKIYEAAGVPDRVELKWGDAGHRFYPTFMWPFIEKAFKEE